MSSANMKLVTLRVPVEDYSTLPKQVLEPGEFIKPVVVELHKLHDKLQGMRVNLCIHASFLILLHYNIEYSKKEVSRRCSELFGGVLTPPP